MDRLNLERLRSDRKRRLFACACVREVWHLVEDERSRNAVEVAEAFADWRATKKELAAATRAAWVARGAGWAAAFTATLPSARDAAEEAAAHQKKTLLVDDIAGPDHLPDVPRTQLVVSLAQAIYDQRRWQDMPILADALEEAGCTDAGILSHLRGPGPHARGCWALDLILSKDR